jgi:ABC-type transporter Mla subunit MlaD
MTFEPKTIDEQIESLAQLTGATESFVGQVKSLFTKKGISLGSDATPYLRALEEAFRREESIRTNSQRAKESIAALQQNFSKIGQAYVRQVEQLKKIQSNLRDQTNRLRRQDTEGESETKPGGRYVTRRQREDFPMVPGPEEVQ